jgi:hypothetical protein
MEGQIKWPLNLLYVPYVRISKFLEGELRDMSTLVKWNVYKNFPRLLLFPSNMHKNCEMQKHKDNDNISVKCRHCN